MAEQRVNIKFVTEVKKYPCLYNYTIKEYSKKDITEKAWNAVGETVNLSALQAKEKWKNLRTCFVRYLKLSVSSKKKRYYLADAMQFALPFIKPTGLPCGSLPVKDQLKDKDDTSHETNEPFIQNPHMSTSPPLSPQSVSTQRSSSPIPSPSIQHSISARTQNHMRNNKILSEIDETSNDYIKPKMAKYEASNDNANKMFLLSLLPDLNCMSLPQVRIFKREVIVLIENILNVPLSTPSSQTISRVQMPNINNYTTDNEEGLNFDDIEAKYIPLVEDAIDEAN